MSIVKKLFSSIRIKIILLALLGIFGMCMIAGVYKYIDYTETAFQKIGNQSQEVVRATNRQALIEERFITTGEEALIREHKDLQKNIADHAESIKNLSRNEDIIALAGNILAIGKSKNESFESVVANVLSIREKQAAIVKNLADIRGFIQKAVKIIDLEATEKIMEGELLESSKSELLVQFKDFIGLWNLRLINIQELFILRDKAKYDTSKAEIDKTVTKKEDDINTVIGTIEDTELVDLWGKAASELPQVNSMETSVASLWEENLKLKSKFETLASKAQENSLDIENAVNEILAARSRTGDIVSLAVTASCIGILVLLGMFILRTVIKPINNTVVMIKDIAEGEGDLTRHLEIKSNDEIGEMAKWFNIFIENIRGIIKEVFQNAGQLNESSGSLAAISEQMSHGAEDTSSKANTVAAASEEMSTNILSVASVMEQAAANMNTVATSAEQMTATINEIAQNTEKAKNITNSAVDQAANASHQMDELGNAAQEIGKVIETITEISEQVNLLALNATIEAARAGEAGKGFAVVANEIKELARQTADATGEIKQRVEGIQGSTGTAVNEINSITKVVNEVNEIVSTIATAVEEQSATTREIAGNVTQASTGINEANENVSQSSRVSSDIAGEIAQVTQSANEMSNSSAQVNMSSVEMSKLAEALNEMVGRFKV